MSELEIIKDKKSWDEALQSFNKPSTMLHYNFVDAGAGLNELSFAEMAIFRDRGDVLYHPYVRRSIKYSGGYSDIISAFDFGGFFDTTNSIQRKGELVSKFEKYFFEYANSCKIVSEFCRVHPFYNFDFNVLKLYECKYITDNVYVFIDRSYEEIWKDYAASRKRLVKQGRRNNFKVEESRDFSKFIPIYYKNLDRLKASKDYYFPIDYLKNLNEFLDLYYLYTEKGELCSAHVYLKDNDNVFAFLPHSMQDFLNLRPNDFLYDHVIEKYSKLNLKNFHLGGGVDSLRQFKSKFSNHRIPYYIMKAVFQPNIYKELVLQNYKISGSCTPSNTDFFPEYRQWGNDGSFVTRNE